jgi:hypothetical protein
MTPVQEPSISEMNDVISGFMGLKHDKGGHGYPIGVGWCTTEHLKYHSSWDWLMSVVGKIESLFNDGLQFYIKDKRAYIEVDTQQSLVYDIPDVPQCYSGFCESKIQAVYKTVYQFITWHNTHKPTQP